MNDTQYLKIEQLAQRWNVSVPTIKNWVYSGKIPYVKLGRCTRVLSDDAKAFEATFERKGATH